MSSRTVALRNLQKARAVTDPRTAACGRRHIQYEVALQFAVRDWQPMTADVVMDAVFWELKYYNRRPSASHYQRVRRAMERFAVRDKRLPGRGRPWVWRLKDEILSYPGGPEEWWWGYKHPFRQSAMDKYLEEEYLNTTAITKADQTDEPK